MRSFFDEVNDELSKPMKTPLIFKVWFLAILAFKLAFFGFIIWVIVKLMQHFGVV
jgi:flagellar biogenesis protein FliO